MGNCASHVEYYFGFVNVSVSHLDILSFFLGCIFTVAAQALYTWCKGQRKASKHIITAHKWGKGGNQGEMMNQFMPYMPPQPWMMPPPGPAMPTAPAPPPTTALVPWKMSGDSQA